MSDYLIINGESLEVEKKFDKCVVEGFGSTTEDISSIIVPVEGQGPGPSITVVPLSVTENGTYEESGKAYSPVTVNVPGINPQTIWRGTISQYEALSIIDSNTTYVISNSCPIPYVKLGSTNLVPTTEEGYECAIYNYTAPSGGSYGQCMIPIAQINRYPAKGWQLEFNVNAQTLSRDNVICGTGNATDGLREVYIKNDGTFWLYDKNFGDHQVYSGSITNKDVIIRRAIGSGSFTVIVNGTTVYTGTMSNRSNDLTLAVANYSGDYNFTGTINYLKFKWLE